MHTAGGVADKESEAVTRQMEGGEPAIPAVVRGDCIPSEGWLAFGEVVLHKDTYGAAWRCSRDSRRGLCLKHLTKGRKPGAASHSRRFRCVSRVGSLGFSAHWSARLYAQHL